MTNPGEPRGPNRSKGEEDKIIPKEAVQKILQESGLVDYPITCMRLALQRIGATDQVVRWVFNRMDRERTHRNGGSQSREITDYKVRERVEEVFAARMAHHPELAKWYEQEARQAVAQYESQKLMEDAVRAEENDEANERFEREDLGKVVQKLKARGYDEAKIMTLVSEAFRKESK